MREVEAVGKMLVDAVGTVRWRMLLPHGLLVWLV